MFNLIALLLEGSEKLSSPRIGYSVLLPIVIATSLLITWVGLSRDDDMVALSQDVWIRLIWPLALLTICLVLLALLSRPSITNAELQAQLAKAHTLGLASAVMALVVLGNRAIKHDFPNSITIAIGIQALVFLFGIVLRTFRPRDSRRENDQAPRARPLYIQFAIVTGTLLLGSSANMRALETQMSKTPFRSEADFQEALHRFRKWPNTQMVSTSESKRTTTRELVQVIENDDESQTSDVHLGDYAQSPFFMSEDTTVQTRSARAKEEALRPFRNFIEDTLEYRNHLEDLERYRFVRNLMFGLWCVCILFWIARIILRFRLSGNFDGF